MSLPEPPSFNAERVAARWRKKLFAAPCADLERALGVPDPPDRAPKGLTPGAWRAWREAQSAELAREHWENLATRGLVPAEWLGDDRRVYLGARAAHVPALGATSTTYVSGVFSHPATPDAAIALAGDMANALAVEQLAREAWRLQRRFDPSDALPEAPRIVWSLSPKSPVPLRGLWSLAATEPALASEALMAAFFPPEPPIAAAYEGDVEHPEDEVDLGADEARASWLTAAIYLERLEGLFAAAKKRRLPWRGALYEPTRTSAEATLFASFDEIEASPYAPQLEVLRRGYGYAGFDAAHGALRIEGVYG